MPVLGCEDKTAGAVKCLGFGAKADAVVGREEEEVAAALLDEQLW